MTSKNFTFTMLGTLGWIPFFWNDVGALVGGYASSWLVQRGRQPLFSRKAHDDLCCGIGGVGTLFHAASSHFWMLLSLSLSNFGVGIWSGNLHAVPADGFPVGWLPLCTGWPVQPVPLGGSLQHAGGHFSTRGNYAVVFLLFALLQPLGLIGLWLWLREPDQ